MNQDTARESNSAAFQIPYGDGDFKYPQSQPSISTITGAFANIINDVLQFTLDNKCVC